MKPIIALILVNGLLAGLATAQPATPQYKVADLGALQGGAFSQATSVNSYGLVAGLSVDANGNQRSVLWYQGFVADLGPTVLGGPNSGLFGINARGQALGQAEGSAKDPNNENFCAYGTGLLCLPFLWQNGVTTQLPLLGGNNGTVGGINNRGESVGVAETAIRDAGCPTKAQLNGTGPQIFDFEAVIWGPAPGQIRELPPLPGDTVAMAFAINDKGQVAGMSGLCGNSVLPGFAAAPHAVFWDTDGSVHDLGNLGGTSNPAVVSVGNVAFAINNQGQIAGVSALAGNQTTHPFLWTKESGIQDLGLLPGDLVGAALAINNHGVAVGASISPPGLLQCNPSAVIWQNGLIADLNALVPADSTLQLLTAFAINDAGEIVGFGVQKAAPNNIHAFLAIPNVGAPPDRGRIIPSSERSPNRMPVPEDARTKLWQLMRAGKF